jgi:hypothetical protein
VAWFADPSAGTDSRVYTASSISDLLVSITPSDAVIAATAATVGTLLDVLGSGGGIADGLERLVLQAAAVDCIDSLARRPAFRSTIIESGGIRVISSALVTALAVAAECVAPRTVRAMERHSTTPFLLFARSVLTVLDTVVEGSPPPPACDISTATAAIIRFIRLTTFGCAVYDAYDTLDTFANVALDDADVAQSLLDTEIVHATVPALAPGVTSEVSCTAARIVGKLSAALPALRHAFRVAGAIEPLVRMMTDPTGNAFEAFAAASSVSLSQEVGDNDDASVALSVVRSGVVTASVRLAGDASFDKEGRWAAFVLAARMLLHSDPAVVLAAARDGALLGFPPALLIVDGDNLLQASFYLAGLVTVLRQAGVDAVPPGSGVRDGGSSVGGNESSSPGAGGGSIAAELEPGSTMDGCMWSPALATELGGFVIASGIPQVLRQALSDAERIASDEGEWWGSSIDGWRRRLAEGVGSSPLFREIADALVAVMDKYVENSGGSTRIPEMMRTFAVDLRAVKRGAGGAVAAAVGADSDDEHSCWYCDRDNPFFEPIVLPAYRRLRTHRYTGV